MKAVTGLDPKYTVFQTILPTLYILLLGCNGKLKVPKGGKLVCTNSDRVNSACTWQCPPGTILNGRKTTVCRTDRTWSILTPPQCKTPRREYWEKDLAVLWNLYSAYLFDVLLLLILHPKYNHLNKNL